MPRIEYEVNGCQVKEDIGEEEIEKAFNAIAEYDLNRILIYDYDYRYFEIQKHLFKDIFQKFDLDYLLCYHQKVICIFPTYSQLEKKGINFKENRKQLKAFISYSHKDKMIVYDFEEAVQNEGLPFWIDKKCIDIGEHILDSMMNGIKECDIAIIFLSNSYKDSAMCRLELRTFFSQLIVEKKKWFLIKLDDVDPEEIYPGFNMYKYYEYTNMNELKAKFMNYYKKLDGEHSIHRP